MKFTYNSNNSGGDWWLTDEDWLSLEKAGWKVNWIKDDPHYQKHEKTTRWLGALATEASIEAESLFDAIRSFEMATGQDYDAEGCECCGRPHSIYEGR